MNPAADVPPQASRRFGGRWLRPTLVCLGSWAVMLAIFYAEEDWRGQRDWNRYRQAAEARGESLDFRAYVPKPVPQAENFAASDIVQSWMLDAPIFANDLYSRAEGHIYADNRKAAPYHRQFTDLVAWQLAFDALQAGGLTPNTPPTRRPPSSLPQQSSLPTSQNFHTDKTDLPSRTLAAPAVLEGLKANEEDFTELRLASARPYSRFPVQYGLENPALTRLPHLAKIKAVCQRLSLRACAELAAGQSDKAADDVKLMLYLADALKTEPFQISYLVRAANFQIAIQPVWEGLAEHRWTEAQLQELQARFQHYDFLADLDQSLKVDRAFIIWEIDVLKKNGLGSGGYLGSAEEIDGMGPRMQFLNLVGRLMPAGWYDFERLNLGTLFDLQMKEAMNAAQARVFPGQIASNSLRLQASSEATGLYSFLHHRAFATLFVPPLSGTPIKAAVPQTAANQAAISCALERYRLAKGQFPEKLESLTPQFISRLPNDVITGQPYKYRRTGDGQFLLYSVGWNEKDDGGVPGTHGLYDEKEGDWVWDYPVK